MSDGQIEKIEWDANSVPRQLGRHIRHDPRNRRFAAPVRAVPTKDKRHRTYGSKLDQGSIGACTAFAATHCLNTTPARQLIAPKPTLKAANALDFYRGATRRDPWEGSWEPEDTGSSGLAVAQELKALGLITRYEWAFGFSHGLGAINERPWMQGTYWYESMFYPNRDGRALIEATGTEEGGHEYLWVGVEIRSKISSSQNRSWFLNSWGINWGQKGFFYMTWPDHEELLSRDGDLVSLA